MPTEGEAHRSTTAELEELNAKKLRQDYMNIMPNGSSNEVSAIFKFYRK